jgi:hypothetical protein
MRIHNATFNLCHRKQQAVNKEGAKSEKKREAAYIQLTNQIKVTAA